MTSYESLFKYDAYIQWIYNLNTSYLTMKIKPYKQLNKVKIILFLSKDFFLFFLSKHKHKHLILNSKPKRFDLVLK